MTWTEFLTWHSAIWPQMALFAALVWVVARLEKAERQIDRLGLQLDRFMHAIPDEIEPET